MLSLSGYILVICVTFSVCASRAVMVVRLVSYIHVDSVDWISFAKSQEEQNRLIWLDREVCPRSACKTK